MNKKDAAVYKALAELGFDHGHEIPDPKEDEMVDRILHPDETFLDAVEDLFKKDPN